MKDEQLKSVLARIDLNKCDEIIKNHIYYSKRPVRQRCYRGDGSFRYINDEYEFLIIAENGEKQAIILRCGYVDLHWYVLRKWRNRHILSDALRTGVIQEIWPEKSNVDTLLRIEEEPQEKKQEQHR